MPSKGSTHILDIDDIQAIALHNFGQRDWSALPAAVLMDGHQRSSYESTNKVDCRVSCIVSDLADHRQLVDLGVSLLHYRG